MDKEETNQFLTVYNKVVERVKFIIDIYGNFSPKKFIGVVFDDEYITAIYSYNNEIEEDKFPLKYLYLTELEIDEDIERKNKHKEYAEQLKLESKAKHQRWLELNELRRLSKIYKEELKLIINE